jgi:hypothetical protein
MRTNHLIDAGEWPSFCQKRLLQFGPGIAFSMLIQPSLPQPPKTAASITSLPQMEDFLELQSIFMRMNHEGSMDAEEWPSFDHKMLSRFEPGIAFSMLPQRPRRAAS